MSSSGLALPIRRLWPWLALSGAFLLLVLPHIGAAPLERAEIYFLDAGRSMFETGDAVVPRYRGEPFYDKPALTYWSIAGAFSLLGPSAGAGRAVSALAAAACLAVCGALGTLLLERRAALAGVLVLATTFGFLAFSRLAMSDMLLTFCVYAAMVAGGACLERGHPLLAVACGAALGAGFLTKGPIGLVLAGAGLALLAWDSRRRAREVGALNILVACAAFVTVGGSWFVFVWLRQGIEPLRHFFLQENVQRFAGSLYDSGEGPLFFPSVYLSEGQPWSLFALIALGGIWRARQAPVGDARGALVLLLWIVAMATPLTLSRGKIDYYLLPVYPAASLLVGRFLTTPWTLGERRCVRLTLGALALAVALIAALPTRVPQGWSPDGMARFAWPAACLVAAGFLLFAAVRGSGTLALAAPATASAVVFAAFTHAVLPAFVGAQPNAAATRDVARELRYRPDAKVVACEDPARLEREILFEARATTDVRCDLLLVAASKRPSLFVLTPKERDFLQGVDTLRDIARYPMVPAAIATLGGLVDGVAPTEVVLSANYDTEDPVAQLKWRKERRRDIRRAERAGKLPD